MSSASEIVVSRNYKHSSDYSAGALALLLKKQVSKKGGPATAPDDAMKGSNNDRASSNCT